MGTSTRTGGLASATPVAALAVCADDASLDRRKCLGATCDRPAPASGRGGQGAGKLGIARRCRSAQLLPLATARASLHDDDDSDDGDDGDDHDDHDDDCC